MPLKTFWKPIELDEYYETDMTEKRFFKKVGGMEDVDSKVGQYLAKPLRDSILKNKDLINRLQEGGSETALRHHDPVEKNENLVFEKYVSHGQRRQDMALAKEKKVIDFKTSKKDFEADIPFDFHQQQ